MIILLRLGEYRSKIREKNSISFHIYWMFCSAISTSLEIVERQTWFLKSRQLLEGPVTIPVVTEFVSGFVSFEHKTK